VKLLAYKNIVPVLLAYSVYSATLLNWYTTSNWKLYLLICWRFKFVQNQWRR